MKFSTVLYLFPVVLAATGCGLLKMPETTDQMAATTSHMSGKTDHLADKTDQLADKTDHLSGTTDHLSGTTDKMAATTKEMADGVHDQELLLSLDDMLKDRNTDADNLSPAPFLMFPGGKKFAERATSHELAEFAHLLILNINDSKPDESKKVTTTVKGPDGKDMQVTDYPTELKAKVAHDKLVKFSVLAVIASFTPQEKIEQIAKEQILASGVFEDDAYVFFALRSKGISEWLFKGDRSIHLENVKKIERGIEFLSALDYLGTASFAPKLQYHFVNELLDAGARDFAFDPWSAVALWKRVNRAFSSDLDKKYLQKLEEIQDPAIREDAAKIPAMKAQVQASLDFWKKRPKP